MTMLRERASEREKARFEMTSLFLTLTPIATAVLSLTSSPNLREAPFLSLTKINGTLLEEAKLGRCFVSHRGLQSEATRTTYMFVLE